MKSVLLAVTVFLATAAFTACPPKPGPVPPSPVADATVDGDDGGPDVTSDDAAPPGPVVSTCALACAALAAANCPHGSLTVCAAALTRILSDGKIGNPQTGKVLTCVEIAQVRTPIDAMALGFKCP